MVKYIKTTDENDITTVKIVNEISKKTIGFIKYSVYRKEANINYAFVEQEYRGKKILTNAMTEILCDIKCKGISNVFLSAYYDTPKNIWNKLGFLPVSSGVASIMKKEIKEKCICNK